MTRCVLTRVRCSSFKARDNIAKFLTVRPPLGMTD
jgi:hypothetical protein